MTQLLDPQRTVGELVVERPGRARVLEELGIDYCCGGGKALAEACQRKGLNLDEVSHLLAESDEAAQVDAAADDPDQMGLAALADHIVEVHHALLRRELPRLYALTSKVRNVHWEKDVRLKDVAAVFEGMMNELATHILKEEQVLFPMIRQIEQAHAKPDFHCGSLANPVAVMEHEHQDAGDALASLSELTDGFTPPDWACNTYRVMIDGLRELESDLHQHIHKENNILFPKAIAMEQALRERASA